MIFTLRGFSRRYVSGHIQGNTYIDKRYGVTFEFPEGWQPDVNTREGTNILIVVHKNIRTPYPYVLLTGYDVGRYFFKSLPQISDSILEQEFKTPGIDSHKIVSSRSLKQGSRSMYEVIIDVKYLRGDKIRASGIFIKNGRHLFFLSFNDKAEDFEKNVHFFNEIADKFKVGV